MSIIEFMTLKVSGVINSNLYYGMGGEMKYTERIRALREDKDLTQAEIVRLLKVGQKTYSDYELGKTRIPLESVMILARFYDVSMDYICGTSDEYAAFPKK